MPLVLFDKRFHLAAPPLAAEYSPPPLFDESRDLFASLPAACRPDHRWLIIGGPRSGSSWHVDPNATSAWNAVCSGRKKWILCPPHAPPPGITASDDGGEVTCPISLYEWYRVFYTSLRTHSRSCAPSATGAASTPMEAVVGPGELLFVPRGWWHSVLNLSTTVAVTQNYAPRSTAKEVLDFLRAGTSESGAAAALVSGVPPEAASELRAKFEDVLGRECPAALRSEAAEGAMNEECEASGAAAAEFGGSTGSDHTLRGRGEGGDRGWWRALVEGGRTPGAELLAEAGAGGNAAAAATALPDDESAAVGGFRFCFGFGS